MSQAQVNSLARRMASLEKWRLQSKQPNLGFSTIDGGGAIQATDEDDTLTLVVGKQFDGTNMAAPITGPVPPTPSAPVVEPIIGGLKVKVDGTFTDGSVIPMDFSRWEIHVSQDPEFIPDLGSTLYATIESPRGGEHSVALPYVPHYVRVIARTLPGKGSSPSDMAGPHQPSFVQQVDLDPGIELGGPTGPDGVTPATSPDVVVSPLGIGGILASWAPVANPDPVSYEVYVSLDPITETDPNLLLTTTQATQVAITSLAAGTAITPGQQVYVRVRAIDEDGPSLTLGAESSATTRKATNSDISADYVYGGLVDATQIQTGSLQAVLAVLGGLTVGDLEGKHIKINPATGFEVIDEAGQVIVSFPVATGGINKFVGDLVAQGFTAEGRTQFRGVDNEISMNSIFTLANGVTAPSNVPSIDTSIRESITTIATKDSSNFNATWQGSGQKFSYNEVEGKYATLDGVEASVQSIGWYSMKRARIQQVDPGDGALDSTTLKFMDQPGYSTAPEKITSASGSAVVVGTPAERALMTKPGDTYSTTLNPWDYVTDGITDSKVDYGWFEPDIKNTYMSMPSGQQTLTIQYGELEDAYGRDTRPTLSQVKIWHYNGDSRRYNTKVEISPDGTSWTTIFDSAVSGTYAESASGKTINFTPQKVLYVRDTLNGSDANAGNHWTEVQAFGDRWDKKYMPTGFGQGTTRPVRLGSHWYMIYEAYVSSVGRYDRYLGKFDLTGQQVAAYNWESNDLSTSSGGAYAPELTTDGTDLITAQIRPADGHLVFKHYSEPTGATPPPAYKTVVSNVPHDTRSGVIVTGFLYGTFDMGAPRYLALTIPTSGSLTVYAYDDTGARVPDDDWDPGASFQSEIAWDGTRFVISAAYGYGLVKASTSLSTDPVRAAFSWYDSDLGGTGTHETTVGPVATANRRKRFGVSISASITIPDAGDADSPDSHRIYAYEGDSYTGPSDLKLLPTQVATNWGITQTWYTTTDAITGTTAPPLANSFPNGYAAQLVSALGGFVVKGDGTGAWPYLTDSILDTTRIERDSAIEAATAGMWLPGDLKWSGRPGNAMPGWLEAKGQRVLQADYPDLFDAYGFTYGPNLGDGTFPLPDGRKKNLRGADDTTLPVGTTGGSETITITPANLPPHTHDKGTLDINTTGSGHTHNITRAGSTGGNAATVARGDASAAGDADTGTNGSQHTHGITGLTGPGDGTSTPIPKLDPYLSVRLWVKT